MLAGQPPQLLQALGMPADMIQSEFLKHEQLGKLKVRAGHHVTHSPLKHMCRGRGGGEGVEYGYVVYEV